MKHDVDSEFLAICREILSQDRTPDEWADTESDDEFQSEHYEGGWDDTEEAFTFSYYDAENSEYWFQLTLDEVREVSEGTRAVVDIRPYNT